MSRPSDREMRAALATVVDRIGTPVAKRVADDLLNERIGDGIFEIAEIFDIDGNALLRDFTDEVHNQTGYTLVPAGRLH